jgi:hypothetical protein
MGSVLENCSGIDGLNGRNSLRQHVIHRSSLLNPPGIMVGIASKAGRCLPGHRQLGELGVAFVKFRIVGLDFLIRALVFSSLSNL